MDYKASHPWVLLSHLPLPSSVCLQWFWESIQIDACANEMLYLAKVGSLVNPFLGLEMPHIQHLTQNCTNPLASPLLNGISFILQLSLSECPLSDGLLSASLVLDAPLSELMS